MKYLNIEDAKKLTLLEVEAKQKAIKLYDDIILTLSKFDEKIPSKRIDTALKKIDSNLSFKENGNSLIIELYIEKRSFKSDNANSWIYLDFTSENIVYCSRFSKYGGVLNGGENNIDYPLEKQNTINFELLKKQLEKTKEQKEKHIEILKTQLENVEELIKEHDELVEQLKSFNSKVHHSIANNFDLTKFRNVY